MAERLRDNPRLRRRARRQAKREVRPYRRQARQDIAQIRRETRREKASIQGAANLAARQIGNVKLKGLRGPYRRDLAQELARRSASVRGSVPFLQSAVGAQAREDISAVRREIPRVGDVLPEKLDALVQAKRERQAEKAAAQREGRAELRAETQLALQEAERLITIDGRPENDEEWAQFQGALQSAEGVGLAAARRAVKRIRAQAQVNRLANRAVQTSIIDPVAQFVDALRRR